MAITVGEMAMRREVSQEASRPDCLADLGDRLLTIAGEKGDPDVLTRRLAQLARATGLELDFDDPASVELIHTLSDLHPKDSFEQMLGAQMVACHHAALECFRRAMIEGQGFEARDMNLKHAAKFCSTYARLLDAFNKHRGRGQQKVTVEHVHVAAGGQAIVGSVERETSSRRRQQLAASPKRSDIGVSPALSREAEALSLRATSAEKRLNRG